MENRKSSSGKLVSISGVISGLDPGNIPSGSVLETTASFPGAQVGDVVDVSPTDQIAGGSAIMISHGRCTTTDVIAIGFANMTTGAVHPATASFDITCLKNP